MTSRRTERLGTSAGAAATPECRARQNSNTELKFLFLAPDAAPAENHPPSPRPLPRVSHRRHTRRSPTAPCKPRARPRATRPPRPRGVGGGISYVGRAQHRRPNAGGASGMSQVEQPRRLPSGSANAQTIVDDKHRESIEETFTARARRHHQPACSTPPYFVSWGRGPGSVQARFHRHHFSWAISSSS